MSTMSPSCMRDRQSTFEISKLRDLIQAAHGCGRHTSLLVHGLSRVLPRDELRGNPLWYNHILIRSSSIRVQSRHMELLQHIFQSSLDLAYCRMSLPDHHELVVTVPPTELNVSDAPIFTFHGNPQASYIDTLDA